MVGGRIALCAPLESIRVPAKRQRRKRFLQPEVAAGIAKEDQVIAAGVFRSHLGIVLDGQFAAEIAVPLISKAAQTGVRPGLDLPAPGLPCAAYTEERGGKGVVNRPL